METIFFIFYCFIIEAKYKKYTMLTERDTTKIKIKVIHTQEVITNQNQQKHQQKSTKHGVGIVQVWK